jgi:fatty acid desaturase
MPDTAQTYAEPTLSGDQGRKILRSLHDDLRARGLLEPSLARVLIKLSLLLVLLSGALWLAWLSISWPTRAAGHVALALLLAQFAFVGHDCGHGSSVRWPALNRSLGQLAMTLVTGLAFDEWITRHRAHHRYCQDQERDPDMAVAFVASLTLEAGERKGALGRFATRHQALHVWLFSLLFGHSQRHLSQAAALGEPRRHALDVIALLLHFTLWLGVPVVLLDVPSGTAALAYFVPVTLLGPYLAAIFWVNHIGMPLIQRVERFSFVEHQLVTSRTIINPWGWDWLFGGLNFQVEHHLCPRVPSHRLSAAHAIIRDHLDAHGLPYRTVAWPEAVRAIADHFRRVARAL